MYITASGVAIPQGTDAFTPPTQFKGWADAEATWDNFISVNLDSDRLALAAPQLRDGVTVYVRGTNLFWTYEGSGWSNSWISGVGAWTPYVPTLTGVTTTGGTLIAETRTSGEDTEVHINFILGSGSAITGSVDISLPVAVKAGFQVFQQIGNGTAVDSGNGFNHLTTNLISSTVARVYAINVAGTYSTFATLGGAVPFAWGLADGFDVMMKYRRV